MPSFIDKNGKQVEVTLEPTIYKEAAGAGLTVPQYINNKFETTADAPASTFEQMCVSANMIMRSDREFGIRTPSLAHIFEGKASLNAGLIVKDADPASRILFPAVILEMIENQLKYDRTTDAAAFERMIAIDSNIAGNRAERPIINYTGPAAGRSAPIGQLSKPKAMLRFTTSDTNYSIPTYSLGMEMSDEALRASTLDLVTLSINRQTEEERHARIYGYLLAFLNGDVDMGDAALDSITAQSLDDNITAEGTITHKAWVKYLLRNRYQRSIDYVVTDIDTYLLIENRTNKPVITTDDPTSPRLDALPTLVNLALQNVKFFIVDDSVGWPANTIMGIDSRYAIQRIRNSSAAYSAVEDFVLTKSKALRFDFAEILFRLYDTAFDVMTLTVAE